MEERFLIEKKKKIQIAGELKDRIEKYNEQAKTQIIE
jgi:hypothetical protein